MPRLRLFSLAPAISVNRPLESSWSLQFFCDCFKPNAEALYNFSVAISTSKLQGSNVGGRP
jgi:hypothetical protein